MKRIGPLTKRERVAARKALAKRTIQLANPEEAKQFEVGEVQTLDLSDPDVCKFLFGKFWEDCIAPDTSPEKEFTMRVTKVDVETGTITTEPVP